MTRLLIALFIVACLVFGLINTGMAQTQNATEPLTDSDVLKMVRTGISPEEIISKIKTSRCHFDTTPTVVAELKFRGVPDSVVAAMQEAPDAGKPDQDQASLENAGQSDKAESIAQGDKADKEEPSQSVVRQKADQITGPAAADALEGRQPGGIVTADLSTEITLGFGERTNLLSRYRVIKGTKEDQWAQDTFGHLRSTGMFSNAPALPYDVTLIDRDDPNAFSTMGGHLYVTSGLAKLLGDSSGLWAAVEGHELGHNIGRHAYKSYLREAALQRQIAYYKYRIALGDQSANWSLIGVVAAGRLLNNKMDRNDENEADRLGLNMMVEAGYHPDFAINLFRKLKARVGEESKFAALFSDHPRWVTREENIVKLYDEAIASFQMRWPNVSTSPGGQPPFIANFGKVSSKQNKQERTLTLSLPYNVRNAKDRRLFATLVFMYRNQFVRSADQQFEATDGSLLAKQELKVSSNNESGQMQFVIPSSSLGTAERKLKAKLCLVTERDYECSKDLQVEFPKN